MTTRNFFARRPNPSSSATEPPQTGHATQALDASAAEATARATSDPGLVVLSQLNLVVFPPRSTVSRHRSDLPTSSDELALIGRLLEAEHARGVEAGIAAAVLAIDNLIVDHSNDIVYIGNGYLELLGDARNAAAEAFL
jgi:hypothetical protein